MNILLYLLVVALCDMAYAGGGAGEGWTEHATRTLIFQAVNFSILVGGLIYYLRRPVVDYFKQRAAQYYEVSSRAREQLTKVRQEMSDLQKQITKLEMTWQDSILKAQGDAAEMRNKMVQQAQETAQKAISDFQRAMEIERNSALESLKKEFIEHVAKDVERRLATQLTKEQHRLLQTRSNKSIEETHL
ncbi:MAG: ATP synthase F0 subunit B [Bdellovibrionaceae bacterium]|nr:ATP synthase F0 subunit B [Pseudobdellovibrionaceae bacterium]MDW8189359.1 ATP synthase F0 subunit B [Pseudobdellovibrionaceae bacterium]